MEVGVPATTEHVSEKSTIGNASTKHVVEAVQVIQIYLVFIYIFYSHSLH